MRLAIPTDRGKLSSHFARCEKITLVKVGEESRLGGEEHTPPPCEPGALPQWIRKLNADAVITSSIETHILDLFIQNGTRVLTGAPALSIDALVEGYLDDSLYTNESFHSH